MRDRKGVSLIEIVLFIVVFSLGVVGIMVLFYSTLGKTSDPIIRVRGVQVAQAVMDEIFSKKWDELIPEGGCKDFSEGVCADPALSSLGPDSGEDNLSEYDDVDDYVNEGGDFRKTGEYLSEDFGLTSGFRIKLTVEYVNITSAGEVQTDPGTKTPYKMITVEVIAESIDETYTLRAIKADF